MISQLILASLLATSSSMRFKAAMRSNHFAATSQRNAHNDHSHENNRPGASSLTFVIDVTGSMYDDLVQVREGYQRIFDTVLSQRERQVSNYVLVPFHDPDVGPAIVSDDVFYLRAKMDEIDVQGGGDCPEMTLTGIKLALENSLPNSFIYVFTDARAKDYHLLDQVLSIVQEKQSQVVFVMTGDCGDRTHPGYLAFESIASMSSGQIFHLDKSDVNKIIEYVRLSMMNKRVRIVAEDHEHSRTFAVHFPVDSHLFEITVSVAGDRPDVHLLDPQVSEPQPGMWTIKGSVNGKHTIRVTGISDVDFTHAFSNYADHSNGRSFYRPVAGMSSYLLVNVTGLKRPGAAKVAQLLNTQGEAILSEPLRIRDEQSGLYYVDSFIPPDGHYYTMISGEDELNFQFQRLSPTSICPTVVSRPPLVRMAGHSQTLLYQTATLTCHVESTVPYTVYWYKDDYEHIGGPLLFQKSDSITWTIPSVSFDHGGKYKCAVSSHLGNATAETVLEIVEPPVKVGPPRVVHFPENTAAFVHCLETQEMATVTWQRRGEPLRDTHHMQIFSNGTLLIARITKSDEGPYVCNVLTPRGRRPFYGFASSSEKPTVTVHPRQVDYTSKGAFTIRCDVQGSQIISVEWLHDGQPIGAQGRRVQANEGYLSVVEATQEDEGRYECRARNPAGSTSDFATTRLRGKHEPKIEPEEMNITVTENETAVMECKAQGHPPPTVQWEKQPDKDLERDLRFSIGKDQLVLTGAEKVDAGVYLCTASNEVGKAVGRRRLIVQPPVRYIRTPCDEMGRAVKTSYVPARGDTPMLNRPMLPWDTEVIDFPAVNGTNNVFVICVPPTADR
ncbi:I-set and ig and VWA 2 domain containing protein [Trichuris trichiura]|uniref:I-set and ig and VWA 2 domain containing protein n=1 Tax=Trichuris trichiura TaxID=36087 RepID=A0A077Z5I7_TRITR|nr:I-set and ig and VWA 2 domain containing protein [Trichuris trichiura]